MKLREGEGEPAVAGHDLRFRSSALQFSYPLTNVPHTYIFLAIPHTYIAKLLATLGQVLSLSPGPSCSGCPGVVAVSLFLIMFSLVAAAYLAADAAVSSVTYSTH